MKRWANQHCASGAGNAASNRNGVGYGEWTHIDGWSEAVIDYIAELESAARAPEA